MAKAFSIRDFMQDTWQQDSGADVYGKVSIYDIGLNPDNRYIMSEIEKIKDSIYALGGIQQNVVLVKCPDGADHKYLALDGHRRLAASRELVEEGFGEFEFVPAVIKGQIGAGMDEAVLVLMNSTQRNKTDWEKVMEHMRLKEIIPKLKKRQGIDGRTRDIEADMLGVSRGQISIYNTIGTRLNTKLMQLFETGNIGISLAHAAAQLDPELQHKLVDIATNKGGFDEDDIRQLANDKHIDGQMGFEMERTENVPDSGTFEKLTTTEAEQVAESGTFEKSASQLSYAPPEKQAVCYTSNESDVDGAIYFIFCCNDFPEDKLHEIIDRYVAAENSTVASIAAEVIFNKMLPYKNGNVNVIRNNGYQVEYIHTGEIYNIPAYYFWKGFEKKFGEAWKKEETEQVSDAGDTEKTTESATLDEPIAVGDEDEEQEIQFRGGYEVFLIDDLTRQYTSYLQMAVPEQRKDQICKFNCLLDALDLLRKKLEAERGGNDLQGA